jgi:hypothetical protein
MIGRDPVEVRKSQVLGAWAAPALDAFRRVRYGPTPDIDAFPQHVDVGEIGNSVVASAVRGTDPCLVARLGHTEARAVNLYTRWRRSPFLRLPYNRSTRRALRVNAGFFPADDDQIDRFAERMLSDVSEADVMAVWLFIPGEHTIIRERCPAARLVMGECLESMRYQNPWTAELSGKVVLVVHPFARSIEAQYREHRGRLFANPKVLPEFELKTLRAIQSIGGNDPGFKSWFDALDHMCDQIAREKYDIAVIGAGAYGLPLGAFVKRQGGKAVVMGGATQVLFGIKGRRYETDFADSIGAMFNESWVRPLPEETPRDFDAIEGGAYW